MASVLPRASFTEAEPEALVDAIASEMTSEPRRDLVDLTTQMGAPASDCLATVLSARATLMAASRGRGFYLHEARGRIPMPPHMSPEVDVWEGETVPIWQDGVFVEPKYFSFRQDAPFAAYNPVHRRKWRPHELLHGAVGFFWRKDASRFETYVGARLNELVPVVHWYGLDEIFRPRCARHRGQILHREWCNDCEAAVRPYWEVEVEDSDRESAVRFLAEARAHFASEMEACRTELSTGRTHESPRGRLNASSDAVGYLLGHWPRVTSWSFSTWAELFLREGFDYFADLEAYADRVEACASRLTGGAVATTPQRFDALRQRRILQDVGYRALVALEWLDPDSAAARAIDKTVMGAVERCSVAVDDLVHSDEARWEADDALGDLIDVLRHVRDEFPDPVADALLALGLPFMEDGRDGDFELANLAEGIAQGTPLTADRVDAGHIETFSRSESFETHGRIASRFARYLRDRAERNPQRYALVADLATLEAWAGAEPRRDEDAERFAHHVTDVDDVRPQDLRLNETFRKEGFTADAVSELANVEFSTDRVELVAAYWRGELHLVEADEAVVGVLAAVAMGAMPTDLDALLELIAAGIVVWIPGPRGPRTTSSE